MQGEEELIDYLGVGKHDRSKLSDARSIRSSSIRSQPAIRTLVIAGALESLSVNEHDEGAEGKRNMSHTIYLHKRTVPYHLFTLQQ